MTKVEMIVLLHRFCFQSVGSGLSLEPPATTEADEEEDGMSDIIQEVTGSLKVFGFLALQRIHVFFC